MRGGESAMINLSELKARAVEGAYRSSNSGGLGRIFVSDEGIRAGWSALMFAAIFLILYIAATGALRQFLSLNPQGPIPLRLALIGESTQLLIVFLATLAMARIEDRKLLSYGFTDEHRVIRLVSGVVWGFFCLSVLIGALWRAGWLVFDGKLLTGLTAWKFSLAWGLAFLLVGVVEESLLRGYLQYTLSRGIGFWWAALLLSVVFLLGHTGNGGESTLGLLEVGVAGFYFCISLWFTKSLWWAIGFHAGWDWAQSFFYGTADTGLLMSNHLLVTHPSGNPLWSGGTTGPEGSLLILPLVTMMSTAMWLWWGVRKRGAQ
ncbi:MAG: CPBP family intramembrane glutamic endopeptidase [Candidatus Acidiferrales bacterium]